MERYVNFNARNGEDQKRKIGRKVGKKKGKKEEKRVA